jgi:plastocyanin
MVDKAVLIATAMATLSACGGGSSSSAPTDPPAATITITTSGVSPKSVTVARGSQVQFVNNDTASHDMVSNPHPEHTDCQEINSVGFLSPNQSRLTGNLNTARTCGFHDHSRPESTALQGTITIQ